MDAEAKKLKVVEESVKTEKDKLAKIAAVLLATESKYYLIGAPASDLGPFADQGCYKNAQKVKCDNEYIVDLSAR